DLPAPEISYRADRAVLLDHERRQRVPRPLAALVRDHPDLLAPGADVVEDRREARRADLDLTGRDRHRHRLRGLEVDELGLDAELLEGPAHHAEEDRRRRAQLEHADLDLLPL